MQKYQSNPFFFFFLRCELQREHPHKIRRKQRMSFEPSLVNNLASCSNRQLFQGDRLQKEISRQDRESQGVCALTRALMKVPVYRKNTLNKGVPLLLTENLRRNDASQLVLSSSSSSSSSSSLYQADYSERTLAIIDKAKEIAENQQLKLERTLIAQERRAKADVNRLKMKNLLAAMQSQKPVIELAATQARRMKINGDPAKEVEEMRKEETKEQLVKNK